LIKSFADRISSIADKSLFILGKQRVEDHGRRLVSASTQPDHSPAGGVPTTMLPQDVAGDAAFD
jgi:hypothetical protein